MWHVVAQKELWSSPSTCLRALAPCHDIVNVISEAKSSVFGGKGLLPTKHGFKCPEYVTEFKLLVLNSLDISYQNDSSEFLTYLLKF